MAFSEHGDFLTLSLEFTANDVITAVLGLDRELTEKIIENRLEEQAMAQGDEAVLQSVFRLFAARKQQVWSEFLRRNIMQEVIYDLLCGSCGCQLLKSIANIGQADEIYAANRWMKENFRQPFTVEELAEQRNMSVSLFHQKFKSAVGMGPLQCQKRLRLTEARRLMLDESRNVTEAAGGGRLRKPFSVYPGRSEDVWRSPQRGHFNYTETAEEIGNFFGEAGKPRSRPPCYTGIDAKKGLWPASISDMEGCSNDFNR